MIVEPDFLTHWKTKTLVKILDYEAAPLCVLALWSHCQQRKTDRLKVSAQTFTAICGYPFLDGYDDFFAAMIHCGFIEVEGDTIIVHDFAKSNSQLFANWHNGLRGGRPAQTHTKPINNPIETQIENGQTDRLDKIREDRLEKKEKGAVAPSSSKNRCTEKEAEEYVQSIGLPVSDGRAMYLHFVEKNWKGINDWKLTIQKWKEWRYLPSQKQAKGGYQKPPNSPTERELRSERERKEAEERLARRKAEQ